MPVNYRQMKAIEYKNKQRILALQPDVPESPGIYIFLRQEDGFKYAYVGQAKKLLTRLAQHLTGYQHIDLSIRKHGLASENNPNGWRLIWMSFPESELDEAEKKYTMDYANAGFQLRNKTKGGQGKGKSGIAENKPAKGYYDGLKQGYKNAQRYVANLFDKHLDYSKKSERPNKNQDKALAKFEEFLCFENEET